MPPPEASRLPSPADVKRAVLAVNFTRIAAPGRPGRPSACGLGLAGYRRDQSREPTGRRDADDVRVLRVPCRRRVRWGAARRGGSHMAISMQGVAPRPRLASKRLERAAMRGRADRASASMPPRCAPSPSPGGQFFCHGSARSGGRHDPQPKKSAARRPVQLQRRARLQEPRQQEDRGLYAKPRNPAGERAPPHNDVLVAVARRARHAAHDGLSVV